MMAGNAQADLTVGLEAAGGSEEAEGRRTQRVGGREYYAAVVDSSGEGRGWRTSKGEVPFKEVGVGCWRCVVV